MRSVSGVLKQVADSGQQRRLAVLIAIFVAIFGLILAWPNLTFYSRTGSFRPIRRIDALDNAVAVTGWNSAGLQLADGRSISLPGVTSLPLTSLALAESTKRGVQIQSDGRVFGLVRVHHWCGNDPVREHLARVDLSQLLVFLQVVKPVPGTTTADEFPFIPPGGTFTPHGWRIEEFMSFQMLNDLR
jgi:hypothetical protein